MRIKKAIPSRLDIEAHTSSEITYQNTKFACGCPMVEPAMWNKNYDSQLIDMPHQNLPSLASNSYIRLSFSLFLFLFFFFFNETQEHK